MHHTIVALEGIHLSIPEFNIPEPFTSTTTVYQTTTPEEGIERIRDATIVICTRFPFTAALLDISATPKLQFIAQIGTGYDNIDMEACRRRGIAVANTPGGNSDAVAEHALALFFAIRRNVVQMHSSTLAGEWKETRSLTKYMRDSAHRPPIPLNQEICGIVGYGRIGKQIAKLMQGLGVKIVVASRKTANTSLDMDRCHVIDPADLDSPVRTPLNTVLKTCTTVFVACPLMPETLNLVSKQELEVMRPDAVLINVGRGGVIDEAAIVEALNSGKVSGYATDVFEIEPTGPQDSPLFTQLNNQAHFIASPHVAWFSELTITNISKLLADNVVAWIVGKPQNLIE